MCKTCLPVLREERSILAEQQGGTVKRCAPFLYDADLEMDGVLFCNSTQLIVLGRWYGDCVVVVFGVPFSSC